jgi:hypothetical protein
MKAREAWSARHPHIKCINCLREVGGGADGDARPTIDASVWSDEKLTHRIRRGLIFLGMDAIGWARIHTEQVFDAGIGITYAISLRRCSSNSRLLIEVGEGR